MTDIFEVAQAVATIISIPMVWVYLRSAKKNFRVLDDAKKKGILNLETRIILAKKEILIGWVLLIIQFALFAAGTWAELGSRPAWVGPAVRMSVSILIFIASYSLWSKIVPLHTRRDDGTKTGPYQGGTPDSRSITPQKGYENQ